MFACWGRAIFLRIQMSLGQHSCVLQMVEAEDRGHHSTWAGQPGSMALPPRVSSQDRRGGPTKEPEDVPDWTPGPSQPLCCVTFPCTPGRAAKCLPPGRDGSRGPAVTCCSLQAPLSTVGLLPPASQARKDLHPSKLLSSHCLSSVIIHRSQENIFFQCLLKSKLYVVVT